MANEMWVVASFNTQTKSFIKQGGCSLLQAVPSVLYILSRSLLTVLLIYGTILPVKAQKTYISGSVIDRNTGETLIGANVYDSLSLSGTSTNNKGLFSLALEKGSRVLIVSFVGYRTESYNILLQKDTTLIFRIEPGVSLNEIKVSALRNESDFAKGKLSIPISKVKSMPAIGGEADLIKTLATIPGVAPAQEGSSAMIVRGGGLDQNLFLLDGMHVYNTGHLFNFISVFNPEAIKQVDFYKGSFPSKYGGRLSSVTDITFRNGNNSQLNGVFDIGLINSKITLEGPVNNKTTFLFAARSTYLDILTPFRRAYINNKKKYVSSGVKPIKDDMLMYTFADINLKLSHIFNSRNNVAFNLYSGVDYFRLTDKNELFNEKENHSLFNNVASLRTSHIIGSNIFLSGMIGYSSNAGITSRDKTQYYKYSKYDPVRKRWETQIDFLMNEKYKQRSLLDNLAGNIDLVYYPSNSNTINAGMSVIRHYYLPSLYRTEYLDSLSQMPQISEFGNNSYHASEGSFYFEDLIKVKDRIQIYAGLRFNFFNSSGTVFNAIDPRFTLSLHPSENSTLKLSYSKMTQNNHALIRNGLLMHKVVWVPSLKELPPERSDQVSLGFNKSSPKKMYSAEFELFYKSLYNLVEYDINFLSEYTYNNWENSMISSGKGRAYGMELLIEKTQGSLTGSINYTLSWYDRKFQEINDGNWFPYTFDRRHVFNLTGMVKINDAWRISALWTISSGHRVNIPIAYVNSNPYAHGYYIYDGYNKQRLPVYHRLDISADWQKKNKHGDYKGLKFGLYNAYAKLNAYYLYLDHDNVYDSQGNLVSSTVAVKKKTFLPLVPSINYYYRF